MKRRIIWQDLRDNTIDVEAIGQIALDVSKYHIFGLKIQIEKYNITSERLPRGIGIGRSTVEISFSRSRKELLTKTTLDGVVRFFYKGVYHTVRMKLSAEAEYSFLPYDLKIQDYLYTYFTDVLEHDGRFQKYGNFWLPETLSNYYPGSEWDNQEVKEYHWIDFENRFPMEIDRSLTLKRVARENPFSSLFRMTTSIEKNNETHN